MNIFWRLIGLNRNLNKLLLLEHFWREKCDQEFSLLHDNVPSYRGYYFLRSERIIGTLYTTSGEVVANRVQWYQQVYLGRSHGFASLYLTERRLLLVDKLGEIIDSLEGVTTISAFGDVDTTNSAFGDVDTTNYLVVIDGKRKIVELEREKFRLVDIGNYLGKGYATSVDQIIFVQFYWFLLDDGSVYYSRNGPHERATFYRRGVVQIAAVTENWLVIIDRTGRSEFIHFNLGAENELTSISSRSTNYVKWRIFEDHYYGVRMDGSIDVVLFSDLMSEYQHHQLFTQTPPTLPIAQSRSTPVPIRDIFYEYAANEQNLIVVFIDGTAELNVFSELLDNHPRIKYFGLSFLGDGEKLVAVSKR